MFKSSSAKAFNLVVSKILSLSHPTLKETSNEWAHEIIFKYHVKSDRGWSNIILKYEMLSAENQTLCCGYSLELSF